MAESCGETGKPRFLLLPGMLCSGSLWDGQIPALSQITDVSTLVPTGSTIEEMVDEVLTSVTGPISLVGLSLGGIVAMAAAIAAPERVKRLVIMSATAYGPRPDQRTAWSTYSQRIENGLAVTSVADELWPNLVSPSSLNNAALHQSVVTMADQVGATIFLNQLSAQHSRVDQRVDLTKVLCPTLVVAAAHDVLAPVPAMEEIADLIPHAELVVLRDSGHLSPLEVPEAVSRLLFEWIPRAL